MPPLLSEQAAFAKHLFTQGYPLWNPDPALLPQSHQSAGLQIGDLGTIDERGRFDVFFNIIEPGSADTRPNFPPIEENDVRCATDDLLPREVVSSPETHWDVDPLDVLTVQPGITRRTIHYSATLSNDGAHIVLPQGAELFELGLHHRRLFENHAREHGADWLKRYKDRLGWPRSNSLYLLTGFYKTCSWSIASFGMQTAANTNPVCVHCTTVEVDEQIIREESVWQPTGRFKRKIGPAPDRQGRNNQTVFIRGITITPNISEQGQHQRAGLFGMLSASTRFFNTMMGGPNKAAETDSGTSKSDVIIQHVPHISQASHPSEIVNQYLLAKKSSAKIAVTHDSQWIAFLEMSKEGRSWTLEDLKTHLETLVPEHYVMATYKDTVYLQDREHGSPTRLSIGGPSLLGAVSSGMMSNQEPCISSSFSNVRHIADPHVLSDDLEIANSDGSPSYITQAPSSNVYAKHTLDAPHHTARPSRPSSYGSISEVTELVNLPTSVVPPSNTCRTLRPSVHSHFIFLPSQDASRMSEPTHPLSWPHFLPITTTVPSKPSGNKRALLIATQHTNHKDGSKFGNLPDYPLAHRDAKALRDLLIASHGYQMDDITLMVDDRSYPEHLWPTILHQIDRLTRDPPEDCHFFFYFSGHGLEEDCLDRADVRADEEIVGAEKPILDYILHDRLVTPLKGVKGSKLFALFDCCHSESLLDLQTGNGPNQYSRVWKIGPGQLFTDVAIIIINLFKSRNRRRLSNVPPPLRRASTKWRSPLTSKIEQVGGLSLVCLSAYRDGQLTHDDCEQEPTFTKCFVDAMVAKPNITELISGIRMKYDDTYLHGSDSESEVAHETLTQEPRICTSSNADLTRQVSL